MKIRRLAAVGMVFAAIAVTGCGENDDDASSGGSPVNQEQQPGGTEVPAPSDSPRGETTEK